MATCLKYVNKELLLILLLLIINISAVMYFKGRLIIRTYYQIHGRERVASTATRFRLEI